MNIHFVRYNPDIHQKEFKQLVKATYNNRSFLLEDDYVQWWFSKAPFRIQPETSSDILLGFYQNNLIAFNCHIATQLQWKGEKTALHWLVNTMVHPDYRRGFGLYLMQESKKVFGNIGTISFNDASRPVLQFLKFNLFDLATMNRAFAPANTTLYRSLPNSLDLRLSLLEKQFMQHNDDLIALSRDKMDIIADLWKKVGHRYGLTTNRTKAFLQWRYFDHPKGDYKVFVLGKQTINACAIVRIDGQTQKGLRILDVFGEKKQLHPLLMELRKWGGLQQCAFVDFYCTKPVDRECFEKAGFQWLNEEEKSLVPFLLNPLTTKYTFNENLALLFSGESFASSSITFLDTYFTKGDADRDRP